MLEFSPILSQPNVLHPSLHPEVPEAKKVWPIIDGRTKQALSAKAYDDSIKHASRYQKWRWPNKKLHFISDLHADADALISSLVLCGSIKRTGLTHNDFILSKKSAKQRIIIGGDCLDKGPSNLKLLRSLKKLCGLKKNTILLAGNHDIRLYMGLKALKQPIGKAVEHFFIRMGNKVLPLFKEVFDDYLRDTQEAANLPSYEQCRRQLFPSAQWQQEFVSVNKKRLSTEALERELKKINSKVNNFERACKQYGLTLPMVYLAAQKCYALFMKPEGEFAWFFKKMKLIHREKSFLFTHAGVDNTITKILQVSGVKKTNQLYKKQLNQDLCEFYYGNVANMLRTKYRKTDPLLSEKGVKRLHKMGIHAIVHGHVSQSEGQNITLRSGLLHFECDITLDVNSRTKEGLPALGSGVTSISPKGKVKGISCDAPYVKIFQP